MLSPLQFAEARSKLDPNILFVWHRLSLVVWLRSLQGKGHRGRCALPFANLKGPRELLTWGVAGKCPTWRASFERSMANQIPSF